MSPEAISAVISAGGVVCSILGAGLVVSFRAGARDERLSRIEKDMGNAATKEQLSAVKEDIAEIKGMFRMTLKEQ